MHWMKSLPGAACAVLLALSSTGQAAAPETLPPEVRVSSLSGAFLAARTAEIDNDLEAAVRFYRKALAFDPANEELQRSLMLSLIAVGEFEEALPLAEKLKNVAEVERFSRVALAVDAIRKGEYADAEYYLELALATELDRLVATIMTAWATAGRGEAVEALELLDEIDGPDWFAIFLSHHRALISEHAGLTDEAHAAYEEVTADRAAGGTAPETYLRAILAQARFLARHGETQAALDSLASIDLSLPRPEFQALRDQIAAGGVVEPLVSSPADGAAEILLNVATALNRGGGEAFVRLYLQFAQVLRPEYDAVLVQLGQVAEQQGRQEEAIGFYSRVSAESPLKRLAEMQLGLNLADIDRTEEAIGHLKALVEQDPDDVRAYLALGGVYHSRKDFAAGAELYDRAVARIGEPDAAHWSIFYQRGIAYERLKRWEEAEPNFLKALELEPNQPQVLNYLGYSWVDMNMNLEQGLDMIARAVRLRPNDGYIVDSLGWAYYRLGRYEEAVVELEKAVSLRPEDPILNDHLGDAYWKVGRKLHAVYQWRHARDLGPEPELLQQIENKLKHGLAGIEPPQKEASAGIQQVAEAPADEPGHTVRSGETLWSIAQDVLGDAGRMQEILRLNPELAGNPHRIYPGQRLRLPHIP